MNKSAHEQKDFTLILNTWINNGDIASANQLKSMVYLHLKGIVKKQINEKAKHLTSTSLLEQLPNTTSLLHDAFMLLVPPKEIMDNREQFYTSLALFVRWLLLDELKAKQAQKRSSKQENFTKLLSIHDQQDPYFSFDDAFSGLKKLAPRSYKIALLHYYLGFDVTEIMPIVSFNKTTVYNELATAKAYIRTQYLPV